MNSHLALLEELNDVIAQGDAERRAEVLRRVTDLFAFGAGNYSDDQMVLFDDVFSRLVASIEISARAILANRLAKIIHAPPLISRMLASDDAIDVAGPMLEHCESLDKETLLRSAQTKSQQHLLAISRRKSLDAAIADVLVERGERPVVLSVAGNPGAAFSEAGYATLVQRSEGDDELAVRVGLRRDIPRHHLLRLLVQASRAVRRKLDAAQLTTADEIQNAVAEAASIIQAKTRHVSHDYDLARAQIAALAAAGQLGDKKIESFAQAGKFEEIAAALASLCDLPIEAVERAMAQDRPETVLIMARAAGLAWPTVKAILRMRAGERGIGAHELEQCLGTYSRLKQTTAAQVIEFQRRRALLTKVGSP